MGRWRASLAIATIAKILNQKSNPNILPFFPKSRIQLSNFRPFSGASSSAVQYVDVHHEQPHQQDSDDYRSSYLDEDEDENIGKIPIKAYFLSTSIDLKSMQAENLRNFVIPTSRSTNSIALRFCDPQPMMPGMEARGISNDSQYMIVFHYGSIVLFNVADDKVETHLQLVRRYASGLLPEMRKDDYTVKENPQMEKDMEGGMDCVVVKDLDIDSIRTISSVLGQSIALDYFVSQVDGMVEEFTHINRGMERTGTFTLDRKKLFQLVGKANSNLADVILKVGLFDRSEIAWRDAKYAQIYEYLREEYEVTQRFGNLNFKLKFVEHNIHFLQEVLQNRRSNLLEWVIVVLLSISNAVTAYEMFFDSGAAAVVM
ncbi:OLC1v1032680C1 [Oldenlandia corymbosa var. corymbosa]|uniref:OLC1v1032680C1 n=2 Tax=Oldenlandia corymbosa var. corymbosa TaxID=529605 RepID=A0AAV1CLD7_OLDCO|nr:OLC1v1032680C1 [Oldenlandia corymbosa var. corymbosa]